MANMLDVAQIRGQFPALDQRQVYFDNAGGSQVLRAVVDAITKYLTSTNVQLGASYPIGQASTRLVEQGSRAVATYINADPAEVVLGPSTTQLFRNLSASLCDHITADSEIIVCKLDHEANIVSWVHLAREKKCTLKWIEEPRGTTNPQIRPAALRQLMSPRTKLVACTHTSNVLGTINDIAALAEVVHEVPGALFCVDGVAFAPHRAVDVRAWGIDIYAFSWYKVYGPHIATLYVSRAAQKNLRTLGHFFKPTDTLENLLGLGAASYELTASIPEVCKYLERTPWEAIADHEERLQWILLEYLLSKGDTIQVWGEPGADKGKRVPVISFTVKGRSSEEIVEATQSNSDFGCRWGSFYSNRLVEEILGLDPADGVVRVSLVHYNTYDEVRKYVQVLDNVLSL